MGGEGRVLVSHITNGHSHPTVAGWVATMYSESHIIGNDKPKFTGLLLPICLASVVDVIKLVHIWAILLFDKLQQMCLEITSHKNTLSPRLRNPRASLPKNL